MRTFIAGMAFYLLDYFKIPEAKGQLAELIIIGFTLALIQDILEIRSFYKKGTE